MAYDGGALLHLQKILKEAGQPGCQRCCLFWVAHLMITARLLVVNGVFNKVLLLWVCQVAEVRTHRTSLLQYCTVHDLMTGREVSCGALQ